jgi:hypothetical protein
VRNGEGGPERVWKPATRQGGIATMRVVTRRSEPARGESRTVASREHTLPGSRFLGLGASQGRRNLREEGRCERMAIVGQPGATDRRADETLEGECKAMGGTPVESETVQLAT